MRETIGLYVDKKISQNSTFLSNANQKAGKYIRPTHRPKMLHKINAQTKRFALRNVKNKTEWPLTHKGLGIRAW